METLTTPAVRVNKSIVRDYWDRNSRLLNRHNNRIILKTFFMPTVAVVEAASTDNLQLTSCTEIRDKKKKETESIRSPGQLLSSG